MALRQWGFEHQDVGNVHVYISYWHIEQRCCQNNRCKSLRCKKLVNEFSVKWFSSSGKKEAIWKECRIGKVVGPLNSRLVWNESTMLRGHMLIEAGHSRRQHIRSHGLNYCRRKITALLNTGSWHGSCWIRVQHCSKP